MEVTETEKLTPRLTPMKFQSFPQSQVFLHFVMYPTNYHTCESHFPHQICHCSALTKRINGPTDVWPIRLEHRRQKRKTYNHKGQDQLIGKLVNVQKKDENGNISPYFKRLVTI